MGLSAIKLIMSTLYMKVLFFYFSFTGVEKNNDEARRIIQRKSNHCDDPAEILRTEYRLGALQHRERQHRKYTKRASEYWEELIKTRRGKKRGISYQKETSTIQESEATCSHESPATTTQTKKIKKATGNRKQKNSQNKKKK